MSTIPSLVSFSPGQTILSADVNSNYDDIRDTVNTYALLTDVARTVTVTNIWTASQTFNGGMTVASGQTITASGVSVAGGVTFNRAVVMYATGSAVEIVDTGNGLKVSRSTVDLRLFDSATQGAMGTESAHDLLVRAHGGTAATITASAWTIARNVSGGIGSASSQFKTSHVLYQNSSLSTTATASTVHATYSLPAGSLAASGQAVRITAMGNVVVATANAIVEFGGTQIANVVIVTGNRFTYDALVVRTGAATQFAITRGHQNSAGAATPSIMGTTPGETLSGAVAIDFVSTMGVGGTFTWDYIMIEYLAA